MSHHDIVSPVSAFHIIPLNSSISIAIVGLRSTRAGCHDKGSCTLPYIATKHRSWAIIPGCGACRLGIGSGQATARAGHRGGRLLTKGVMINATRSRKAAVTCCGDGQRDPAIGTVRVPSSYPNEGVQIGPPPAGLACWRPASVSVKSRYHKEAFDGKCRLNPAAARLAGGQVPYILSLFLNSLPTN